MGIETLVVETVCVDAVTGIPMTRNKIDAKIPAMRLFKHPAKTLSSRE
jgi:hypothetical protein